MIPVSLRLKNFMSYGSAPPVLDFEQFQVACLSGKNGQGKSALLDAITWSLWGEARKSSGSHKPDDELLRIGEREMQVEFVFDIEGERYRVIRFYARSASGKTNRSQLELHLLESANGDYRPLTGASMRETQELIDTTVGLDYDTFINSAFLLQGRSDEFTKKRPGERKEILTRILNLMRYDALYGLAADRERDAKKGAEQAELDIERLRKALEPESEWKAAYADVEERIEEENVRLNALRNEKKQLTERLADLEARAREAAGLQQTLDTLANQLAHFEKDAAALRERIEQAETLLAQRDTIKRDHERYLALHRERDELDTKNELFRGVEKQMERCEADLKQLKNDLESQLEKKLVELKGHRQTVADCEAQLVEAPSARRNLEKALAAKRRKEEMSIRLQDRRSLEEELRVVEHELLGKKEELNGKITALEQQIGQERQAQPSFEHLEARRLELQAASGRRERLQRELETTRVEGQAVADDLHGRSGNLTARKDAVRELEEQIVFLHDGSGSTCPTCGTELTQEHRDTVEARLQESIAALQREIDQEEHGLDKRKQEREELLARYRDEQARIASLDGVPEELAKVQEQIRVYQESRSVLEAKEEELKTWRRQRAEEDFGHPQRRRLTELQRRLDALPFDQEAYEQVRDEASQVGRYEDRLRLLEETAGRKEQIERTVEVMTREAEDLRRSLDDGSALKPLRQRMNQLKQQLDAVGFDPQRFREVKQALGELADAGARMTDLVNAQQNHKDWKQRLADTLQQAQERRQQMEQQKNKLVDLEAALSGKAELESGLQAKTAACRKAEATLQGFQRQLGQLSEKLEKLARDHEQLRERRQTHSEAEASRTLYKHLKTAFGKHGIPSLIIEQTLPEIEDRTNDLLERLTDGKMHVRLETLKDKKTGGTKETLEIKITDEQGVSRAYETFSGGEAFRVNFALRIALAQLLAERSGVRVRTLVVDEGFGTQDQQGVQNLVEAIQVIKDDFDKILVITHLPELKEIFPVRIEVEKDPVEGSRFEVLGV
ncbi:MAG: AAA family ATPase [Rhodothermales bacterium]